MKKVLLILTLVLAFLLTSCTATVEKGQKLMRDREYQKAIDVFSKVVDKDDTNYDAWLGIVRSQIKEDEYEDAEDTLKDLYEVIDEHYDPDSDVDYESIFDDFQKYAEDIIEEEGSIGSWYEKLQPAYVDLTAIDSMTYELGDVIELEAPKDADLYYSFDNDTISDKDDLYKDNITLNEEGYLTLSVAAINKFGFVGPTSYAYITVATIPDAPTVDTESGTYDSPLFVYFGTYDVENQTIYYTLDGSDPIENGYSYYEEDGLQIPSGKIQLRAVIYDYNSGMYSPELTVDYDVAKAPAPIVDTPEGTYTAPLTLQFSGFDVENATVYYTIDGTDPATYGYYFDPTIGLVLEPGEYQVRAIVYDYITYEYSEEFTGKYIIN